MISPNTILAGIDLSTSDEKVVPFAALFHAIYKSKLIFYHVTDPARSIVDVEKLVKKRVEDYWGGVLPENVNVLVEKGDRRKMIAQKSDSKEVEMIILGRKFQKKNPLLTSRLLNSSGCTICLVPDHANSDIKNIVVGVDFSEESKKGLEEAISLAKHTNAAVHCVNVYTVPWGFYSTGKDYNEFAAIMEKNAIKATKRFVDETKYDIPLDFHYVLDKDRNPSASLSKFAKELKADIVYVGSRGMSSYASIFFESTLNKIIDFSNEIPLFIVRGKDEKRSILDIIRVQ